MNHDSPLDAQPVVTRLEDFDPASGSVIERAFFNHRPWVLLLGLLLTLVLGWQATRLQLNASFEKTIPTGHPYIANYLAHKADLGGQTNALRLVVQAKEGTIFDRQYLETLQKLNDEIFLLPGVDRPFMKSLWTSNTRWVAVTEEGLEGGPVIPDGYDRRPVPQSETVSGVGLALITFGIGMTLPVFWLGADVTQKVGFSSAALIFIGVCGAQATGDHVTWPGTEAPAEIRTRRLHHLAAFSIRLPRISCKS